MQGIIKTIPNTMGIQRIEYRPRFSAICYIGGAAFNGWLEIVYEPEPGKDSKLLEFESFERWLRDNALVHTTIEEFTRLVFDTLSYVLGNNCALCVTAHAETTVHAPVSATIKRS